MVKYAVVAKYPNMCIIKDSKGRRRGTAVGELVMNQVIAQEPCSTEGHGERSKIDRNDSKRIVNQSEKALFSCKTKRTG